jgi:hypothetical protein
LDTDRHLPNNNASPFFNGNTIDQHCFEETFSWGVPGLDLKLLLGINPSSGIIIGPTDPWFTFELHTLSRLSTDCVRRFNLSPALRWMAWMPDHPNNVYEWLPSWEAEKKKYKPLSSTQGLNKVPEKNIPDWVHTLLPAIKKQHRIIMNSMFSDDENKSTWIRLTCKN